jgi:hypothetical protein
MLHPTGEGGTTGLAVVDHAGGSCDHPDRPGRQEAPDMASVVVRGMGSGFAQDVVVEQRHRLKADEPEAAGGTDTGPTPYDYLLVALGA